MILFSLHKSLFSVAKSKHDKSGEQETERQTNLPMNDVSPRYPLRWSTTSKYLASSSTTKYSFSREIQAQSRWNCCPLSEFLPKKTNRKKQQIKLHFSCVSIKVLLQPSCRKKNLNSPLIIHSNIC